MLVKEFGYYWFRWWRIADMARSHYKNSANVSSIWETPYWIFQNATVLTSATWFCIGCGNSSLKQNIIGQSVYMVLWLGSVFVPGNHWPNVIKHWYMVNTETILHYNAVTTCQASKPRHAGAGNIFFWGKNNKFNVKCRINGPPVPSHNLKY